MGLLDGRKGLIFGVANDRSIACYVAKCCLEEGATCGFAHLPGEKNERPQRRQRPRGARMMPRKCESHHQGRTRVPGAYLAFGKAEAPADAPGDSRRPRCPLDHDRVITRREAAKRQATFRRFVPDAVHENRRGHGRGRNHPSGSGRCLRQEKRPRVWPGRVTSTWSGCSPGRWSRTREGAQTSMGEVCPWLEDPFHAAPTSPPETASSGSGRPSARRTIRVAGPRSSPVTASRSRSIRGSTAPAASGGRSIGTTRAGVPSSKRTVRLNRPPHRTGITPPVMRTERSIRGYSRGESTA